MYKSFEFYELAFTKDELLSLKEPVLTFLAGSSLAANDVSVLQRLSLLLSQDHSQSEVVNTYISVNVLIIIRLLASKIYEYTRHVERVRKSINGSDIAGAHDFIQLADEFLLLQRDPEFEIVKEIRHSITNHYPKRSLASNLQNLDSSSELSFYLHQSSGNSLYPLGEDIGTIGLFKDGSDTVGIPQIMDWVSSAAGKITSFQQSTMMLIVEHHFPEKRLKRRLVPVEARLVGDIETRAPILLDVSQE